MKKLLRPKVLIPVILSISLLVGLLGFADISKVLRVMEAFQHVYLLYVLLLMGLYEAVRCVQWHVLLKYLDIHVPLRTQVFTFLVGETTKNMPIGNFFQNYLLQQSKGADFGLTSSATLLIVLIEVAVSLVGLVILGLDDWTWLRPLILIGTAVCLLLAWGALKLHRASRAPRWMTNHDLTRKALYELRRFRSGARHLLHPRPLGIAFALGAVYTVVGGIALYMVMLGLNIRTVSLDQALAIYFFSLTAGLILPVPADIGTTEATGVGALLALSVSKQDAVGVMLINRVLGFGSALAIALVAVAVMPGELQAALHLGSRERRQGATPPGSPAALTEKSARD